MERKLFTHTNKTFFAIKQARVCRKMIFMNERKEENLFMLSRAFIEKVSGQKL
jgi:hypothetical protein